MKFQIPVIPEVQGERSTVEFSDDALRTAVGKIVAEQGIGGYEPETIGAALALVVTEKLNAFADVGANIGIFGIVMKSVFGNALEVDAYEPLPSLKDLGIELAKANDLHINFSGKALSNTAGQAKFYVSARSDSSNSLNADFRTAKAVIDVELATIDQIYCKGSIKPLLFKIDTESTEPDVIDGAERYISSERPWIICEVLKGRGEDRLQALVDKHGYHAYHLTGEPLVKTAPIAGDPTYTHRDWLFAPRLVDQPFNESYLRCQAALRKVARGGS